MQYYGTRLSENISRREPEGYLLCLNVPVARTGWQEYLPEELGVSPPGDAAPIRVFRPESEVFARETVSSFEGMPVTDDHPPDGVDAGNIRRFQAGHAHNVRRGAGEESDLLLADLMITDPRLIEEILGGKREISCGYTYELAEENGHYIQRKIRGNHIAVVDAGRAGSRVSIRDHRVERRKNPMKKNLTRWLTKKAKDGDMETVAEFIEEVIGEAAEEQELPEIPEVSGAPEESGTVTLAVPEEREITIDGETVNSLLQKMEQTIALLSEILHPAVPAEDENPEEPGEEDPKDETPADEIAEMVEAVLEEELSTTVEEEDEDGNEEEKAEPALDRDTLRAVLHAVRPAFAAMTPRQRRKVAGDISSLYGGYRGKDSGMYAALASSRKSPADLKDLGKRIMASRNPCYRR